VKDAIKTFMRGPFGSYLLSLYLRFVSATSRHIYVPADPDNKFGTDGPYIYATWHGHSFIFASRFRAGVYPTLMVAAHGDGRMVGQAVAYMGVPLVYGSGTTIETDTPKGGARAALQLLKILRAGKSVTMTADVPKISQQAGPGVILIARKSGVPIMPVAMTTSRRRVLNTWDKMQWHLPFSKLVFVAGDPIFVPKDGSNPEVYQTALTEALNVVQERAYQIADGGPE
jgi:3-deoxy-D-manno-octulosonic-acid transferase